jgi:glycosyltransferase involved in cell wall biosynthesis
MSGLRIIQTPVRFSPAYGGVEKYVLELSKQLVATGNDVTVVCADEPPAGPSAVQGVQTVRLPYIMKISNTNITPCLFRTLLGQDFDIMHTHIPTPWSADISALVSLVRHKPLFVTYHNDLTGQGVSGLIAQLYNSTLLHLVLWRAKKIIVTQPNYVERSRHLSLHTRKIASIPLGVTAPLKAEEIERRPSQIAFMSVLDRYHEYKGLDVLLHATARVKDRIPEVKLLVGGGGELIPRYKKQARALRISDCVEFLGPLPDQALAHLYASSSVFVLPSLNKLEGFGIVALEALSYATPVVTTHLAGSSEFITENGAGSIVPPEDAEALATAIVGILEDHGEARAMGARGAAAVEREFSWETIAQQMIGMYT